MKQRVPRRAWYAASGAARRPRALIEDDRPALAISDFALFEQAGFDVAFCPGPGGDPAACPLLRGQRCAVVDRADAVLHGVDPSLGIAEAIRRQRPGLPVLVMQRHNGAGPRPAPADGLSLPPSCSVKGQIDALWRALTDSSG